REAWINPMSVHDVRQFIEKWHEAVAGQLECMGKPSGALKRLATELADLLPDHPPIARLATNPLLCAMICALHRDRGQKLPESQSELCEALCQMLLHRREVESGLGLDKFPEATPFKV
ncbi:MAG: NACHT domain-containing protein, partial [Isosphaeraceae bacterium]